MATTTSVQLPVGTAWTSLGAGPMTIQNRSLCNVQFAIQTAAPSVNASAGQFMEMTEAGHLLSQQDISSTDVVWVRSINQSAVLAVVK